MNVLSPNVKLISPKTKVMNFKREELSDQLLLLAKRRKLMENCVAKYRGNQFFSTIFTPEEVYGELMITLTQVLNAWEAYTVKKLVQKKKRTRSQKIKREVNRRLKEFTMNEDIQISSKTKLDTFGMLTGYMINAFKNNISRIYTKYQTDKRTGNLIHLDAHQEEHEKNALEGLIAVDPLQEKEYQETLGHMIKFLRSFDRQENHKYMEENKSDTVPAGKKSQLARLFVGLLNPKYKGSLDELQSSLGWSDYIFKRQKERLIKKLRLEFKEEGPELLSYVIDKYNPIAAANKDVSKQPRKKRGQPRMQLKIPYEDTTCEANLVFSLNKKGKKFKYTAKVTVDRMVKGQRETIKSKSKSITKDGGTMEDFQNAKKELQGMINSEYQKAQETAKKKKAAAIEYYNQLK